MSSKPTPQYGTDPRPCPDCGGSGRTYSVRGFHDPAPRYVGACDTCDGTGISVDDPQELLQDAP